MSGLPAGLAENVVPFLLKRMCQINSRYSRLKVKQYDPLLQGFMNQVWLKRLIESSVAPRYSISGNSNKNALNSISHLLYMLKTTSPGIATSSEKIDLLCWRISGPNLPMSPQMIKDYTKNA